MQRRLGVAVCVVIGAGVLSAAPAAADPTDIAAVQQRISALEEQTAAATSKVSEARAQLQASQDRLTLFSRHTAEARVELATQQHKLEAMAREMYVNGGFSGTVLTFTLDDPQQFLHSLDQLSIAGDGQSTVVKRARDLATSLATSEAALTREQQRLTDAATELGRQQAATQTALVQAQTELAGLEEQARQQQAAEQQAAELAAIAQARAVAAQWTAAAASVATASTPTTTGGISTATSTAPSNTAYDYGDSVTWAAQPKQRAVVMCESGGNYTINTGNGYYGAWQFDYPSWHENGGGVFADYPHQATKAQQDFVAWTYWRKAGWRPWACGYAGG